MSTNDKNKLPPYMTIRDFCHNNPSFSENSIRWYIQHHKKYDFEKTYCRIGRRIMLKPQAFFDWIESRDK